MSESDILAVLTALSDVMVDAFLEGHRVYLRGLGYFDITLTNDEIRSLKEKCPEGAFQERGCARSIFAQASGTGDEVCPCFFDYSFFQPAHGGRGKRKAGGVFCFAFFITRMEMQCFCGFKRSMALACINRLIDEGRLRNMGTRRTPVYVPVEGAFPLPDSEAGE